MSIKLTFRALALRLYIFNLVDITKLHYFEQPKLSFSSFMIQNMKRLGICSVNSYKVPLQ